MNLKRLKKLQESLEHPILIKKKENLLYLTGRSFMHGYLLIKPINTDKRRMNADADLVFFGDGLEKVKGIRKTDYLGNIAQFVKGGNLILEDQFTFSEADYIKRKLLKFGRKVNISHKRSPIDVLRQIKEPAEISLIQKSMEIVEQVFSMVRREIKKPGMNEVKLANFIKQYGLKLGAEDISFPPIVASGANAAVPHHVPGSKKLKVGESIILDFGFKYKGYCSDFTRTVFLKTAPKKLSEAYEQVEKAYQESIRAVSLRVQPKQSFDRLPRRPSDAFGIPRNDTVVKASDIYQRAVDVLAEKKLDKYFIHSLGHGTGLEIHELPNLSPGSKDILQDGMVFSIEPGVYFPKVGGIRIEDLVYVEKGKVKKFIDVPTTLMDNIF